jgi:hypothetical protein
MKRQSRYLRTIKSYRFTPTFAHNLTATANGLNISESEFVRMALTEVIGRIQSSLAN